jgi:hypothetical protein
MKIKAFCVFLLTFSRSVIFSENFVPLTEREKAMISHVETCITRGENLHSKLSDEIIKLEGMSSPKVRHFLNNLCTMTDVSYLEIGCWKGSTFVASMFENHANILSAVAIDDWSDFGGPKEEFLDNCSKFLGANRYAFYEKNCFAFDIKPIFERPVNIYFYDGAHTESAQELAFTYYDSVLDDVFVAVVDDWNHPPTVTGTRNAFQKLGYQILFERILPANWNGDTTNWWNGLYVSVIRKATP